MTDAIQTKLCISLPPFQSSNSSYFYGGWNVTLPRYPKNPLPMVYGQGLLSVLTQLLTLENIGKRIDQRKVWHIIPSSASHPLHSYCFVGSVVLDISYANAEKTRWQLELLCFLFLPHHLHNNAKSYVCMADFRKKRFSFAHFRFILLLALCR